MTAYAESLLISRLLSAVSSLQNTSSTTTPDYDTFLCDIEGHLKAQIVEAAEIVCRQYRMDPRELTEQICVDVADDDKGREWYLVHLRDVDVFHICLTFEQIKMWFGGNATD